MKSINKFKVMHCPEIVAGNAQELSLAERRLGVESKSYIFRPSQYGYKADEVLMKKGSGRLHLEFVRWRLLYKAFSYDLIHYNFGQTIMPAAISFDDPRISRFIWFFRILIHVYTHIFEMFDVKILKIFGKTIFVTFQGDDIRQGDFCKRNFKITFADYVDENYYSPQSDEKKRTRIKKFNRYADRIYALNPDLMYLLNEKAKFIPYSHINLNNWLPKISGNQVPLLLHAPSNRDVKGTSFIINAVNSLKNKGINFDFILVENMSQEEARAIYEKADLVVDQLLAGWYGGLAVELMSMGKPVISYIRGDDLKFIPNEMRAENPIISSNPENIEQVLEFWLTSGKNNLEVRGLRGRKYVERWHDSQTVASMVVEDYLFFRKSEISLLNRLSAVKKDLLTLVSGSLITQLIAIASTPLLTRIYDPAEFATLATLTGLISILSVAICGRYEMAIMDSRTEHEVNQIVSVSVMSLIFFVSLTSLFVYLFDEIIFEVLRVQGLKFWITWFFLPLIGVGLLNIILNKMNWKKDYKKMTKARVTQAGMNSIFSIGYGGLLTHSSGGMMYGYILGIWGSIIYLYQELQFSFKKFKYSKLKEVAYKYRTYPLFSMPAAILDVASMYACIFVIGRYYPEEQLGLFSLTHRLLLVPIALVGDAVARVFFQRASEMYRENNGNLKKLVFNTSYSLFKFSIVFFVFIFIFAPFIFEFLFGEEWREAGSFARWVMPAYLIRLIVSPISPIFLVTNSIKTVTVWQVTYFLSSYTILIIFAISGISIYSFLLIYALNEVILYGIYFFLALKVSKKVLS